MYKKTYTNTTLTCSLQESTEIQKGRCHTGAISKTPGGFRFEEAVRKGRPPHNPKLYDGKFISMVKRQDGRYQCYLKAISEGLDKHAFAEGVYQEIINALKIID